ncbi:MAG: exo-alpha-sialidase [Planctomycetes bacterium]|nr:exo-alpha-sialidase [Planctomycetota bacterium]
MLEIVLLVFAAAAQQPRSPEMLDSELVAQAPALASVGDLSLSLWVDQSAQQIYAAGADGRAVDWASRVRVDDDLTGAAKFVNSRGLAVANGVGYAAWRDLRNGAADAYWSRTSDGGLTWSTPARLDDGYAAGAQAVTELQVVASAANVFVAMLVERPGGGEDVYMASSMDFGSTWNPTLKGNTSMADCDSVAICCEGMNAFMTWADDRNLAGQDDLFLRMTHNGGVSWMMNMDDEQIDQNGPGVGNVAGARIQITGGMGGLAVAWLENKTSTSAIDEELHVLYSPDGGHIWPLPEAVLASGADVDNQSLAFDMATLAVAWEDDRSGSDQVYVSVSKDFGFSWTESTLTSQGGAEPVIAGYEDLWAVAFCDGSAVESSSLAVSRDGGFNFLPTVSLKNSSADCDFIQLSYNADYENFTALWLDDHNGFNQPYAGGARSQTLTAVSPTYAVGDSIHFEATHFPFADFNTPFVVLLSSAQGSYRLPFGDGRNTGLLNNPYQPAYLTQLGGIIDFDGNGVTPTLTIPNTPGATWHAVGLAYLTSHSGAVYLLRMTDLISITVQ